MTQERGNGNQGLALLLGNLFSANGCQANDDGGKHTDNKLLD